MRNMLQPDLTATQQNSISDYAWDKHRREQRCFSGNLLMSLYNDSLPCLSLLRE